MSPQITATLVAALVTVIVAIITAWATLKVHSIRCERRVNLLLPRLDVYKTLWSLMDEVRREFFRTGTEELTEEERNDIADTLNNWYFADGNGIFPGEYFGRQADRALEAIDCSPDLALHMGHEASAGVVYTLVG